MTKRILTLLLALTLVLTPILSVMGSADNQTYNHDCPYIFVHGFMGENVYVDPSDPNSDVAWPPSTDAILDVVKKAIPALGRVIIDKDWDRFCDTVIPYVNEMFDPVKLDASGNVKDKSGARFVYPEASEITAESDIDFIYDWRIDPIVVAGQLNDFINYVCESSHCDKVVLEGHSYGGVILNTYARIYGTDKVRSFFFNSTAVNGETFTGELMLGKLSLNAKALTSYLRGTFNYNENEELLNGIFALLEESGILEGVCKLGNKILDKTAARVSTDCLAPLFGGWLSIWAMIPDDAVQACMTNVFDVLYKDSTVDHSGLRQKIESYNTLVRPYKADTMRQINQNCNLYVLARTGYSSIFAVPSWQNECDITIDVKFASFGATAAKYGETLTDEQLQGVDSKCVSPMRNINASTCMFPEQTWFIRNLEHSKDFNGKDTFVKTLLFSKEQKTIDSFEKYPRFMYYNEDTNEVVADKQQTQEPGRIEKIIAKIKEIINFIRGLFVR